jgi:hypothetical protein
MRSSLGVKLLLSVCLVACLLVSSAASGQRYSQTNLVSDIPGLAKITDKSLVNALGKLPLAQPVHFGLPITGRAFLRFITRTQLRCR